MEPRSKKVLPLSSKGRNHLTVVAPFVFWRDRGTDKLCAPACHPQRSDTCFWLFRDLCGGLRGLAPWPRGEVEAISSPVFRIGIAVLAASRDDLRDQGLEAECDVVDLPAVGHQTTNYHYSERVSPRLKLGNWNMSVDWRGVNQMCTVTLKYHGLNFWIGMSRRLV